MSQREQKLSLRDFTLDFHTDVTDRNKGQIYQVDKYLVIRSSYIAVFSIIFLGNVIKSV